MKIEICSRDADFRSACRSVLEVWRDYLCMDAEIELSEEWENLPTELQAQPGMLFLDADSLQGLQELKSLDAVRAAYGAMFVCSWDSRKAIECYRLRPTAFLSKPLTASALDRSMCQCVSLWQGGLRNLELTESRSRLKLPMCDILWAEATGRSCTLHCMRREVQIGIPMNELVGQLPGEVFLRCQRSSLVNLHHVKESDRKFLYMTDGTAVSIGRGVRAEVLDALRKYQQRWNWNGTE